MNKPAVNYGTLPLEPRADYDPAMAFDRITGRTDLERLARDRLRSSRDAWSPLRMHIETINCRCLPALSQPQPMSFTLL